MPSPSFLRPFFSYYGSKWSIVPRYPGPRSPSDLVVEPFAGSASYACRHYQNKILLVDANPVVAGLWQYLVRVSSREILDLPAPVESVDDLGSCPQEARWLVGFWLGRAMYVPRRTLSAWGRDGRWATSFWGEAARDRIARQVGLIRHWEVRHADYQSCGDLDATWFVDPPYEGQGRYYRRVGRVDHAELARWCRERRGRVIVCENDGASWLPFEHLVVGRANSSRGRGRVTREAVWVRDDEGRG